LPGKFENSSEFGMSLDAIRIVFVEIHQHQHEREIIMTKKPKAEQQKPKSKPVTLYGVRLTAENGELLYCSQICANGEQPLPGADGAVSFASLEDALRHHAGTRKFAAPFYPRGRQLPFVVMSGPAV
jgi:hypothetical protein